MKKTLSIILVAAMLFCMAPVFGLFAAEADTIDTADEFIAFADAVNAGTWTGGNVTVGADLDFAGKTYNPIAKLDVNIDFGGHTVKNLDVAITITAVEDSHVGSDYYDNWHCTAVGLIANYIAGGKNISNLVLEDSSLTVTADGLNVDVGGVVGTSDRGYVNNVAMDGVEITTSSTGKVGTIMGCQMWNYNEGVDIALADSTLGVKIDAANANVGLLVGDSNDTVDYTATNVTLNVEIVACANDITKDTFKAAGAEKNVVLDGTVVNLSGAGYNAGEAEIEAALKEIDTAEELALLSARLTEKGTEYRAGETIKVTADLDFTGVEYAPLVNAKFILDFQDHVVSNLNVTTAGVTLDGKTCAGLIANSLSNNPEGKVYNVTLKDCTLTTTAQYVGGVVGGANRGSADNVTLENVTINAASAQYVAGVMGFKWWGCNHPDMSATLKNVTINAGENTVVALMVGTLDGLAQYGGAKLNVVALTVDGLTVTGAAAPDADEYLGANRVGAYTDPETGVTTTQESHYTIAEGAEISVDLEGSGNEGGSGEGEGGQTPAPTGDVMVLAVVLAVIALAGVAVVSKKRSAC